MGISGLIVVTPPAPVGLHVAPPPGQEGPQEQSLGHKEGSHGGAHSDGAEEERLDGRQEDGQGQQGEEGQVPHGWGRGVDWGKVTPALCRCKADIAVQQGSHPVWTGFGEGLGETGGDSAREIQ